MQTLTDIIVVTKDEPPKQSPGGIWFPPLEINEESGVYTGVVKVCGPDCKTLKPGMRVMYHRSQCAPMEHEGEDFSVFHEHECLAIVED